jgi:hypothetical protein
MPDDPPRVPAQAFDAAYAACPRELQRASPRQQSDEILRHVARFCRDRAADCDSLAEAMIVKAFAEGARDPFALMQLIADINTEAGDDDFPAAALDPRGRRGWGACGRLVCRPPWSEDTDAVLDDLRRYTEGLSKARLWTQLAANIELCAEPAFIVPDNGNDPRANHMMPVALAAYYLQCFEQRIRDLETALDEEQRSHHYAER